VASDERDSVGLTGVSRRRTFFIAALPTVLSYDGSDDLLNPTRGYRLAGRLSPEASFQSGTFGYARAQIDGSAYLPVSDRAVLAGRIRLGSIMGASRDRIAPSRRFYAGGGGSVRGYGYQDIGPIDADGDPVGGRSLAEFSLEARVRFGAFGVVPFLDGGNLYMSKLPRFTSLRYGAGLGVRYYTSFGPIRVDVGTPLNRRSGDARIAVYVSLGQAF
jgi:translocation and assembly module TamA